ncbi:MAG: hypothetical protein OXR62_03545 [Ahrensia sp.]|nr:hypothetical protein [Ahrensia sp.]
MLATAKRFTASALLLSAACLTTPLHAAEGKALLDKWLAQPQLSSVKMTWETVAEQSSDSFTLNGVTITTQRDYKVTVDTLTFEGLKELDDNRIVFDALSISNASGTAPGQGSWTMASLTAGNSDVPFADWAGGFKREMLTRRVKFGALNIAGVKSDAGDVGLTLQELSLSNADIPLDWRYGERANAEGDPAAPLTFQSFTVSGFEAGNKDGLVKLGGLDVKGANIPTSPSADFDVWIRPVETLEMSNLAFNAEQKDVVTMAGMTVVVEPTAADGTINSRSSITDVVVDLTTIPDPQARAQMERLGYSEVRASLAGSGSYNPETGRIVSDDLQLNVADMFDLAIAYAFSGYTKEVAQKINEISAGGGGQVPPDQAFMAMLPELSKIKVDALKIALTDRSLTGKLLDLQAQQMGTTGDQLAQGAPLMIGMAMGSLGMPQFTEMVSQAVGKFLTEKGTLTVEANPSQPVSVLDIISTSQSNPTQIPELLNAQVSAN